MDGGGGPKWRATKLKHDLTSTWMVMGYPLTIAVGNDEKDCLVGGAIH